MSYSTQPSIPEPARITTFYGENLTPIRGDSTALQTIYRSAKGSQVADGGDRRSEVAAGAAGSEPAAHRGAYAEILDHPTMQKRILIACIGNIFLGDDGFGVAVAQRLLSRKNQRYSDCVPVAPGIRVTGRRPSSVLCEHGVGSRPPHRTQIPETSARVRQNE